MAREGLLHFPNNVGSKLNRRKRESWYMINTRDLINPNRRIMPRSNNFSTPWYQQKSLPRSPRHLRFYSEKFKEECSWCSSKEYTRRLSNIRYVWTFTPLRHGRHFRQGWSKRQTHQQGTETSGSSRIYFPQQETIWSVSDIESSSEWNSHPSFFVV